MEKKRVRVLIDGRVQGVCFRMETRRAAEERGVEGWVRSLPNGKVEAVFEGEDAKVQSMLQWCETGPPLARVNRVEVENETPADEFEGFRIAY
jgi:acylphosphatase